MDMAMLKNTAMDLDQPRTGELLVREGYITEQDLAKALQIKKTEAKEAELPLESLLVKKG